MLPTVPEATGPVQSYAFAAAMPWLWPDAMNCRRFTRVRMEIEWRSRRPPG